MAHDKGAFSPGSSLHSTREATSSRSKKQPGNRLPGDRYRTQSLPPFDTTVPLPETANAVPA